MRLTFFRLRYLVLTGAASAAIVLPTISAGCSRTSCIVYSKAEYDVHASCPAQKDALPYFTDATCPGPVISVDGEGVFDLNADNADHSLCCYPVTQQTIELDDQRVDCIVTGTGGTGGFEIGGSSGVGGVGGGFAGCFTCSQVLSAKISADPDLICPELSDPWFSLQACACAQGSGCFAQCELNLCQNTPVSIDCSNCLSGTSNMCTDAVDECNFN